MLLELAERCEKAAGPDRELDALIWCALNGKKYSGHNPAYASFGQDNPETQVEFTEPPKRSRRVTTGYASNSHAKPVTASLDAAMKLVPEGWAKYIADDEHGCHACVWDRGSPQKRGASGGCKEAATPALALCAAALRARSTNPNTERQSL